MYIRIFYILKAAFLLKGIQQSTIRIDYKPNKKRNEIQFLRTDILSKADILTKTTKNLVIIPSSLRASYLLKKIYLESNVRSDIISLPPVCICPHIDETPSPLSANVIIECRFMWCVRFSKYFCSILTNVEHEATHKSPALTRTKELS